MKKSTKAFTLVELMIVIVIIGILAAIIIPTVSGAINRSKLSADTADVSSMNRLLSIELLDSGVSYFEAYEVQAILADFSLVARTDGYTFWYDRANNQVILTDRNLVNENLNNSLLPVADAAAYPQRLEAFAKDNSLLYIDQDPTSPVTIAINKIRTLVEDAKTAAGSTPTAEDIANKMVEAFNTVVTANAALDTSVKSVLEKYNPATTLYIHNDGLYTANTEKNPSFLNVLFTPMIGTLPSGHVFKAKAGVSVENFTVINRIDVPSSVAQVGDDTFELLINSAITIPSGVVVPENAISSSVTVETAAARDYILIPLKATYTIGGTPITIICPTDGSVLYIPKGSQFSVQTDALPSNLSMTNCTFEMNYTMGNTMRFEARFFDKTTGVLIARTVVNYIEI